MSYRNVFFVDNETAHVAGFRGTSVKAFKVPGVDGMPVVPLVMPEYQAYVASLSEPAQAFANKILAKVVRHTAYDPSSGLDLERDWPAIEQWAKSCVGKSAIVFDFDRTLTKIETFLSSSWPTPPEKHGWSGFQTLVTEATKMSPAEFADVTIDGWVEYFVGGQKRVDEIKELFNRLYALGLDIFILTNNASALFNPELLLDFLNVLTGGRPLKMICSARHPSKLAALSEQEEFGAVCVNLMASIAGMLSSPPIYTGAISPSICFREKVSHMGLMATATM